MREDCGEAIKRLESPLKHCMKLARVALLLFVIMLLLAGMNDLYIYVSHQPTWYPWLSNLPFAAGLFWQGAQVWKHYSRWVVLNRAKMHLHAAGTALTASALDHHLEQADAALAAVDQ